jgi:hypothetical protein
LIAVVALLLVTIAWGATMDMESHEASRPRHLHERRRRRAGRAV